MTPEEIGGLAATALRVEARLTPKPGLVDAASNGAHADMDLDLLMRSADALEPTFAACADAGHRGEDPGCLKQWGLDGERAMLAATGGVNTHKGALYHLGLLAYSVGREAAFPSGPLPLLDRACAMSSAIAAPWRDAWMIGIIGREPRSHGERAYVEHGLMGARGEAATGFATVRRAGLPALWRAREDRRDDELLVALVALMAANPDTNLVARGGIEALETVVQWAIGARDLGPNRLRKALKRADADWSARGWSPGGSADLLAVTWFLDRVASMGISVPVARERHA